MTKLPRSAPVGRAPKMSPRTQFTTCKLIEEAIETLPSGTAQYLAGCSDETVAAAASAASGETVTPRQVASLRRDVFGAMLPSNATIEPVRKVRYLELVTIVERQGDQIAALADELKAVQERLNRPPKVLSASEWVASGNGVSSERAK